MSMKSWEESASGPSTQVLYGDLPTEGECSIKVSMRLIGQSSNNEGHIFQAPDELLNELTPKVRLRLYSIKISLDSIQQVFVEYRRERASRAENLGIYVAFKSNAANDVQYKDYSLPYESSQSHGIVLGLDCKGSGVYAVEIGVYCQGVHAKADPVPLLQLKRITIKPSRTFVPSFSIADFRVVERGEAPNVQKRLVWKWEGASEAWPAILPWSKITGPFSHFIITVDDRRLGYAQCLEFPIPKEDLAAFKHDEDGGIVCGVEGILFGGGVVNGPRIILSTPL